MSDAGVATYGGLQRDFSDVQVTCRVHVSRGAVIGRRQGAHVRGERHMERGTADLSQ